jgi:hypothetical protein
MAGWERNRNQCNVEKNSEFNSNEVDDAIDKADQNEKPTHVKRRQDAKKILETRRKKSNRKPQTEAVQRLELATESRERLKRRPIRRRLCAEMKKRLK